MKRLMLYLTTHRKLEIPSGDDGEAGRTTRPIKTMTLLFDGPEDGDLSKPDMLLALIQGGKNLVREIERAEAMSECENGCCRETQYSLTARVIETKHGPVVTP